ncbi:hypothetical protein ACHAW5_004552 [Stephanodiscus triporus]|uniref:Uncharacterized protein n=1 Tax=Stephanodiscus triporus TaxID=2934178 RepID=A0ABD3NXN2_9STRA
MALLLECQSKRPSQHHTMADSLKKKFDGLASSNSDDSHDQTGANGEIVEEIDGIYTGSKRIITIPGMLEL